MSMTLNPYLNWRTGAREAMERYQEIFGGELTVSTFADGGMEVEPAEAHLVMHAQLETPAGFTLMGADTPSHMPLSEGSSISVSISGDDGEALRSYWDGLLEGGTLTVPLEQAPWGDAFGMLVDRFGVAWLVNITAPEA
ncbi:VOC family protein [Homoserinibacter sp. GY 40078]|uniref:VOC family protein n=1 Tax=Homoserinibacter sp. GY 40078 TaxID=2603275 RepID=UPI0011C7C638|nr:VOC family protein [Homoserinibacter sp. GY 40078]TXK17748.1 VOC family protein [Homoserinibacter sp. GY 40078]